jgi:hypothetical protein
MHDDELLDALAGALTEPVPEPDPDRVAAIRAAAEARRTEASRTDTVDPTEPTTLERHPRRRRRSKMSRARVVVLAAAAAVVAIAIGAVLVGATGDDTVGEIEYAGPITGDGAVGELRVIKTGIGRVVELDTDDLAILPTGELYEVWFVGPGDTPESPNRISAGTFHPDEDGRSQVTFAAAVDPALYPVVQITSELGDGDPSPSTVVVLEVRID